jgi:uncharacterized membrane protein
MTDPITNEHAIERLEVRVGRLLEAGVLLSAACLGIGLVVWMFSGQSRLAHGLLTAGLIALMLTPLARVVASLIAWVRLGDWFFVATTVMVFVVLMLAWVIRS